MMDLGIIKEAYDLPPEFAKEAEDVTKAAIGWIYGPLFRSAFLRLKTKETQQLVVLDQIRKFPHVIRKFHLEAKPGEQQDFTMNIYDTYTWENIKNNLFRVKVHMVKDNNGTTTVSTTPKVNEIDHYFWTYNWAEGQPQDDPVKHYAPYVADHEKSFQHTQNMKDEYIFGYVHAMTTCEQWKKLKEPTYIAKNPLSPTAAKPTIGSDNDPYVAMFTVDYEDRIYFWMFNVERTDADIKVSSPNHESGDPQNPYVYMTLITAQLADYKGLDDYGVDRAIKTAKHEAIHIVQDAKKIGVSPKVRSKKGGKSADYLQTGLPKQILLHKHNIELRGRNPHGIATTTSPYKQPDDKHGRVLHSNRDVEFKTNLYNMVEDFKTVLGDNLPVGRWKEGFKLLVKDLTGETRRNYVAKHDFRDLFKHFFVWEISLSKKNLEHLYEKDPAKFKQYIKEVYKLLFINPEKHV